MNLLWLTFKSAMIASTMVAYSVHNFMAHSYDCFPTGMNYTIFLCHMQMYALHTHHSGEFGQLMDMVHKRMHAQATN